jgi:hypothetical protein
MKEKLILEAYLNYLDEATKWKEKAPGLSDDAIEKMRAGGVIKSKKKYMKGVRKGTNQIVKKQGVTVTYNKIAGFSGPLTVQNMILQHKGNSKIFRLILRLKKLNLSPREWAQLKPLIDRHEANEVVAIAKQLKDKGVMPSPVQFTKNNKVVGVHASPSVLKKEKKMMDFQKKIYPGSGFEKFNKFRNSTGEYGLASKSPKELKKIEAKILELRKIRADLLATAADVGSDAIHKKGIMNKLKAVTKNLGILKTAAKAYKGVKIAI